MSDLNVKVPDIGDASEVEVIEVSVSVGDTVEEGDTLIVLESDKASMEIPAPAAGVIQQVLIKEGDQVNEGVDIVVLSGSSAEPEAAVEQVPAEPVTAAAPASAPESVASAEAVARVPDIGDASDVEVIEVTVAVGDVVEEGDTLIVLESDKASMEIPAPAAGVIQQVLIKEGDQVNEGVDIVVLSGSSAEPEAAVEQVPAEPVTAAAPASAPESVASAEAVARVPDIGDASDVEVIEVTVAVGDVVEEGDTLIVLESDKASMEIPAPSAGTIQSLAVSEGSKVGEGDEIAVILGSVAASAPASPAAETAPAEAPVAEIAAAPVASGSIDVAVPDIGDASDVEVIEVAVSVGDSVSEGDTLIVLESDKASMEIPAPADGTVQAISVKEGDKVSEGSAIASLTGSVAAAHVQPATPVAAPAATPAQPKAAPPSAMAPAKAPTAGPTSSAVDVHAGPAVRALARDLGVDLTKVTPSGPRNRVLKEDVQNFVKKALANPAPAASAQSGSGIPGVKLPDFSKFGPVTREKMSKLHRVTADNMTKSWLNVPAVTQFDEVDITDLEAFRKAKKAAAEKAGVKLTPLPFLIKAAATVLRELPQFNVALDMDSGEIIKKDYVHIGMAVDTPAGLMVPVIRDADKKSIYDIARETIELAGKARDRKLTAADMAGGCFTISSLGSIGGTQFTPIVNTPEVAIMGVSKASMHPVWDGSAFQPRLMMPISLSYDHRAVNGADGARFTTRMAQLLGDIRELLL